MVCTESIDKLYGHVWCMMCTESIDKLYGHEWCMVCTESIELTVRARTVYGVY